MTGYNACCCTTGCASCQDIPDPPSVMVAFSGTANLYTAFGWTCPGNADGSWELPKTECVTIRDRLPVNCGPPLCGGTFTTQFYDFTRTTWGQTPFFGPSPVPLLTTTCNGQAASWYGIVQIRPVPELDGFHVDATLHLAVGTTNLTASWCRHLHDGRACTGKVFSMGTPCVGPGGITCTITM